MACARIFDLPSSYESVVNEMKVIRFNHSTNALKLVPNSFDDLYLLARVIGEGDSVTATTYRRFRPSEGDVGEQDRARWLRQSDRAARSRQDRVDPR